MSTTLTPFLYYTRSVLSLHPGKVKSISTYRHRQTYWTIGGLNRCLSTTSYRSISSGFPHCTKASFTRTTQPRSQNETPSRLNDYTDGSEDHPVYTPKEQGGPPRNQKWADGEEIGFDEDVDKELLYSENEIANLTRSHQDRQSTITDSERSAFQKIFTDILGRNRQTMDGGLAGDFGEGLSASDRNPNMEAAQKTLDGILSNALQTHIHSQPEMETLVSRYPPALRGAAAKAMGLTTEPGVADDQTDEFENRLEELREPMRNRVEMLMRNTKTDFELWEVMEREVFALIPRLGLEDPTQLSSQTQLKRKQKRSEAPTDAISSSESQQCLESTIRLPFENETAVAKDGISPLALYGPLYPSYLLLGLRLLDRSFSRSSPLTLSVLPKVKSLGLISQVLGASTPLYNELLRIYHYRYEDYRGIVELLEEMNHSALEFDADTQKTLMTISRIHLSHQQGANGDAFQTFWKFPEFARRKLEWWVGHINNQFAARQDI